jgi:phospholipid/cholesterol/gamma-HCH transport system substrate-binding protein
VLIGDAGAEIPRLTSAATELVQSLTSLSRADAPLGTALANLQQVSEKLKGPGGALAVLMGNEADARKVVTTIERSNALLARADAAFARIDAVIGRTDQLIARVDSQVLGEEGLMRDVRNTLVQLNAALGDTRTVLSGVDTLLREAQAVATNARTATTDLGVLRADVEANMRKLEDLLNEIHRRWPFARDTELKLP